MRTIILGLVAITVAALCAALTAALAGAQTPEPTPPGPYTRGQCGELAAPSPAFAAPTDLTVRWGPLPDNPQASGALLAWQDNADNETCYVVEREAPGATGWQEIIIGPRGNRENTEDMNFAEPGYYCYRVFAGSEEGRSAYSNEACLEVPEATVSRDAPPGLSTKTAPLIGTPAPAAAASQPAALPATGGSSADDSLPLYLLIGGALGAAGVLASAGAVALARRRRKRL
jgi:hypothetical protein